MVICKIRSSLKNRSWSKIRNDDCKMYMKIGYMSSKWSQCIHHEDDHGLARRPTPPPPPYRHSGNDPHSEILMNDYALCRLLVSRMTTRLKHTQRHSLLIIPCALSIHMTTTAVCVVLLSIRRPRRLSVYWASAVAAAVCVLGISGGGGCLITCVYVVSEALFDISSVTGILRRADPDS